MDIQAILAIIRVATGIAEAVANGTHAQGDVATVAALEDLIAKVVAAHQAEVGTPLDWSKFTPEAHAD